MLRVGLTGGLAAGKSSVAALLAKKGAAVTDADTIVSSLYAPAGPGVARVVGLFGREVLDPQGGVDRRKLADLVAADPTGLRLLDEVIHPLVREAIEGWFAGLEGREKPIVAVVEAALLVETGSFTEYHRLVVVTAPEELRRQRALAAGVPPALVEQLLAKQAKDEEKARVAHYLLENSGSSKDLAAKTQLLWQALLQDAQALASGKPLPQGPPVRF